MLSSLQNYYKAILAGICSLVLLLSLNHHFSLRQSSSGFHRSSRILPHRKSLDQLSRIQYADLDVEYSQAPALFNGIHSSTRQFGSSIYHNGMSVSYAIVPEGTVFYHGRSNPDKLVGMEWLAFEMEQANGFARDKHNRGPGGPHGPHDQEAESHEQEEEEDSSRHDLRAEADSEYGGFIHTFRAERDLRLLYIDGMSAGKSNLGTMDLTDVLLGWPINSHMNDYARAQALCDWSSDHKLGLDGFIRLEVCFEVIFCDFRNDALSLVRTVAKSSQAEYGARQKYEWMKSAENEYHGMNGRVIVDYASTVSLYGVDGIAEKLNYTTGLPRLDVLDDADRESFRHLVVAMAQDKHDATTSHDWQRTTDLIVARYAQHLSLLKQAASDKHSESFDMLLSYVMLNFLDYRLPSSERRVAALDACIYEFLPTHLSSSLENPLFSAVEGVMTTICVSLLHMHDNVSLDMDERFEIVAGLESYLRWTTWLECTGCKDDEICFVTMWPFGSAEDRIPNCKTMEQLNQTPARSYWGSIG